MGSGVDGATVVKAITTVVAIAAGSSVGDRVTDTTETAVTVASAATVAVASTVDSDGN